MSCKILQEFHLYQRARLRFIQSISESASRPQNIAYMISEGVLELAQSFLTDPQLAIRCNAVCAVSRMANHSKYVADKLFDNQIPQILLKELVADRNNNIHFRRAVIQSLKAVARHSAEMATRISECGGLSAFLIYLEVGNDRMLQEDACCGLGSVVRHSQQIALHAIQQGAVTLLVDCLEQNEQLHLKRVAALVLGDLACHSPEHAQAVCDGNGTVNLARNLNTIDVKLKRNILSGLANIAGHNQVLAEFIVNTTSIVPTVLIQINSDNSFVQKQAARLIQEIVKHSMELAQIVINEGGIGALVQLLTNFLKTNVDIISPAALALGYIAGQNPYFGLAIIECNGVVALTNLLDKDLTDIQLSSCIWSLGHIGKHSSEHSRILAEFNTFSKILEIYEKSSNNEDLKQKARETLKLCISCCLHVPSLEILLYSAPTEIIEIILKQFFNILPNDANARRLFITTGGLKKIHEISKEQFGGKTAENIAQLISNINSCFSPDVIKFYENKDNSKKVISDDILYREPQDYFCKNPDDMSEISTEP